jgi:cysteinyl-tRNA synthetase
MLAALHALRHEANASEKARADFAATLRMLGFLSQNAAEWKARKEQASGIDPARVESLIADRAAARARKDFRESDRIRDELAAMGIALKDNKDGTTTWEVKR